jgi:hypothetical protein
MVQKLLLFHNKPLVLDNSYHSFSNLNFLKLIENLYHHYIIKLLKNLKEKMTITSYGYQRCFIDW